MARAATYKRLREASFMAIEQRRRDAETLQGHTPGPWKVDENPELDLAVIRDDENGNGIAEVGPRNGENQANARLIAAAPEMLEALKMVDREIAGASFEYIGNARSIIAAAIARATNG